MLGQPMPMVIPDVVGFKLTGKLREGATATDLVLTVTQMLRKKGVVNKFVEFYGDGLDDLPLADRATIANMAPEYGATCGFFPIDEITLGYLKTTDRGQAAKLVEAYAKKQGLWRSKKSPEPIFTDTLSARPRRRRAEPRRAEAPAGPRAALPGRPAVRRQHGEGVRPQGRRQARQVRGRRLRPRPWRRRDRRHHLLHQHLEPLRHAGRRPDRAQRGEARPQGQAVGQDLAGAGLAGRHRVSRGLGPAEGSRQDRLQPRGLRLHHAASAIPARCPIRSPRRSPMPISWSAPCCRATATSRAASIR